MMVGRLPSFWDGKFLDAFLNFQEVNVQTQKAREVNFY